MNKWQYLISGIMIVIIVFTILYVLSVGCETGWELYTSRTNRKINILIKRIEKLERDQK